MVFPKLSTSSSQKSEEILKDYLSIFIINCMLYAQSESAFEKLYFLMYTACSNQYFELRQDNYKNGNHKLL